MKGLVKNVTRAMLYRCGVLAVWHRWRNRRALTVLMFHRVLPVDDPRFRSAEREFTLTLHGFCRTLDFVQRHYHVISLGDLDAARRGNGLLPRTPLLITFDDGWRDTLLYAAPELRRRQLPAVIFVPGEVVTLQDPRWWQDALSAALQQPDAAAKICAAMGWATPPPAAAKHMLAARVASMPAHERLAWIEQYTPGVASGIRQRQMVTLDELQAAAPTLAIGGHGYTHGPLTLVADPDAELQASQRLLDQLGQGVRSMSFPHGVWSDALVAEAHRVGFEWIFTSESRLADVSRWHRDSPPLGRIHVSEDHWTCRRGRIDPALLATFLFFRPIQRQFAESP